MLVLKKCKNGLSHRWEFLGVRAGYKYIYTIHECERCGRVEARFLKRIDKNLNLVLEK